MGYNDGFIKFRHHGSFAKTRKFLERASNVHYMTILNELGEKGVRALASATPKDTGKTAASWDYKITRGNGGITLEWTNSNNVAMARNGYEQPLNIALLIQYGHFVGGKSKFLKNGAPRTYVQGIDYINPAIRPIFEEIADRAWKEVTQA